jgi:hypothetical protein
VTNIGTGLQEGDTFQLFSTNVSGAFAVTNLPASDLVNNLKYTWTNKLAINGTIVVLTAGPLVNTTPTNITTSLSGNQLTLSWPADHAGWRLQVQTNSLSTGIGSNWFDVPDSTNVYQVVIPVDPANGTVFFRLIYP